MTKPSVLFTLAWVVAGLLQPRAEAISQQKTTEETTPVDLSGTRLLYHMQTRTSTKRTLMCDLSANYCNYSRARPQRLTLIFFYYKGSAMKCSFDGQDYYPEEEFKPSPCSLCICHWSGKVNCTPIICDSVPCGQYAITLHPPKDECCPRCKSTYIAIYIFTIPK